ncbi:MAG: DNA replication/repair protein RecF [Candidatus Zixiibacteriota bacterium]
MLVKSIELDFFRNLGTTRIEFADGVNVFYGKNGAGKTNLLEAIFLLMLARSPRGVNDAVMLAEGAEYYRLEGVVEFSGHEHDIAVAYQAGGRKRITIDKIAVRAAELFETCAAVSTAPEDIELLSGGPSNRREFVNIYLSQASKKYMSDLIDYQKVLAQKNAYLKQVNNAADTPYDELLINFGSNIMMARKAYLDAIAVNAAKNYSLISRGQNLTMEYQPSVRIENDDWGEGSIREHFAAKLRRNRERERVMQTAMVGPHRDDIDFSIRNLPARSHGSQGELRTSAVSLKLAVFNYLKKVRGVNPVLLLDEIFAELDSGRKEMLVELFGEFGQIFLTSASEIPETLMSRARRFKIENGDVFPE